MIGKTLKLAQNRQGRRVLQILSAFLVGLATFLEGISGSVESSVAMGLVGLVALIGLKIGLMSLHAAGAKQPPPVAPPRDDAKVDAVSGKVEKIAARLDELDGLVARLEGRIAVEAEPLQSLTRRTEPALARLAAVQNEVQYLREVVDRLRIED
jgi:hypothetical protein